ncbi:hypothetical protein AF335_11515 [Streptomyces eurocidicus]|uniref:Uncharacterized protein n=1 Tax=Streptomyces eurocidicus TaxID=66423 RepID=A0A2N8NXJ6_STREU|nr:hypothetical protein [Streptomyces eurocidicus]MBB5120550.1 hypothetical protein [Streptomyces eurocidicus]MBF6053761.1 hypothetical protein [Streptomyces eurocidicus]PNE33494.1 hypothetical protein AF335_11515 [Streptomyces eurocidicus]
MENHVGGYPGPFRSGFTRWIEQRTPSGGRADGTADIEVYGVLARAYGLTNDVAELVAAMTGTTVGEVVAAYKADNTEWARTQAVFDGPDLMALDAHLDALDRGWS